MNEVRVSCPNCHQPVAVPVRVTGVGLITPLAEPPTLEVAADGRIYHQCDSNAGPKKVTGL